MKLFLFICFYFLIHSSNGQSNKLILTKEQNDLWIKNFKDAELIERKLILINRIVNDTSINVSFPYSNRLIPDYHNFDKEKPTGYCKPRIIIDLNQFPIGNRTARTEIEEIITVLKNGQFKRIEIFNDKNAYAIYGQMAECGIVVIESANRRTRKQVSKIN